VQLAHFAAGVSVERKADKSPVTAADRESEAVLLAGAASVMPGVPVIAEEAVGTGRIPAIGRRFFLIDPLDGTREYIEGSREFTINVGLIQDGFPVFGILYAPAMAWLFMTVAPDRAVEADVAPDSAARSIAELAAKEVRTREPDPARLVGVTSRSYKSSKANAFLERIGARERSPIGSALKFCLVARGDADVYPRYGSISEWDTAAGHAILVAAGGAVTRLDGQDLRYGKPDFLNPPFIAWGRRSIVQSGVASA
jgi:3'(2'), 5'-bisphosphate nucleotidase